MKDKYKIEKTMQSSGLMWAVVFEGQYRFMQKTKEKAKAIADKMNLIYNKRVTGDI